MREIDLRPVGLGFEQGDPERYVREGYDDTDSDLLLIALAHEVDDVVDLGLGFAPNAMAYLRLRLNHILRKFVKLH